MRAWKYWSIASLLNFRSCISRKRCEQASARVKPQAANLVQDHPQSAPAHCRRCAHWAPLHQRAQQDTAEPFPLLHRHIERRHDAVIRVHHPEDKYLTLGDGVFRGVGQQADPVLHGVLEGEAPTRGRRHHAEVDIVWAASATGLQHSRGAQPWRPPLLG